VTEHRKAATPQMGRMRARDPVIIFGILLT
jgi:hypothetical protein